MNDEAFFLLLLRLDTLTALLLDTGVIQEEAFRDKWDEMLTAFALEVESEVEEES